MIRQPFILGAAALAFSGALRAAEPDLVIFDNDWNAPGSYVGQAAIMPLLTAPNVKLIGLTTVTGDCWRDEGASALLRYLEVIGVTHVPVVSGALYPLVNTPARMARWEQMYGFIYWKGAFNDPARFPHAHPLEPFKILPTPDGPPTLRPTPGTAAQFMIEQVHAHPHQVTIMEGGPFTNLAIAIALDPDFARLAKRLVFQGGVVGQMGTADGFHSDFNLTFDPEAAHITLSAPWAKIMSLGDVTNEHVYDPAYIARLKAHPSPAVGYVTRNSAVGIPLWEEMCTAVIVDPSLVTKTVDVTMDVDIDHGMSYGRTTVGPPEAKPALGLDVVTLVLAVDGKRFLDEYTAAAQTDVSKRGL